MKLPSIIHSPVNSLLDLPSCDIYKHRKSIHIISIQYPHKKCDYILILQQYKITETNLKFTLSHHHQKTQVIFTFFLLYASWSSSIYGHTVQSDN